MATISKCIIIFAQENNKNYLSMRRVIFLFVLCALVLSCVNQPRSVKGNESTHIEKYIDDFRSRFPKGLDNDAQREKMNVAFKTEIKDSLSNDPLFLADYPIKCKSVLNNPKLRGIHDTVGNIIEVE